MYNITKDISIEELIERVPEAVRYLMTHKIQCIACGEPVWGTLDSVAQKKGFTDDEIDVFVKELHEMSKK